MNLFASILTSIIIVLAVWFGAMYQPLPVYAEPITPSTTIDVAKNNAISASPLAQEIVAKEKAKKYVKDKLTNTPVNNISGVAQRMRISDVGQLWSQFDANKALHSKLSDYPSAIYVLYSNISKDFKYADIAIGYNSLELNAFNNGTVVASGHYQDVISGSQLSVNQLEKAWQKLDFSQNVFAVIERHQLNKNADVVNVRMQVMYK